MQCSDTAFIVAAGGAGAHLHTAFPFFSIRHGLSAMHQRRRLIDRDEETCRKRCLALMKILVDSMPMADKYALLREEFEVYNAIDEACFVIAEEAERESASQGAKSMQTTEVSATLLNAASSSSASTEHHAQAKPTLQGSATHPATSSETLCHLGHDAKVAALIEKNRQEALARRSMRRAAAAEMDEKKKRDHEIFESQQWLP